ncbi:cysteine synthase 2 [Quercus suber]|uniref:Cysteine synthase 2 n=1 Tax=Quercus suber TaxID=58331 RepID=A0AAW0J2W7_QUESU
MRVQGLRFGNRLGSLDAFVTAAGTGQAVAGLSIFSKLQGGAMHSAHQRGQRIKNPFDTITEELGINRLSQNFMTAKLDGAFRGADLEAVEMSW